MKRQKSKNYLLENISRMKKKLFSANFVLHKGVVVFLVLAMISAGFGSVQYTDSYFTDIEWSNNNEYFASVLDLEIEDLNGFEDIIEEGETIVKEITVLNSGTIPFNYEMMYLSYGSDDDFCDELHLYLTRNGDGIYTGDLKSFNLFSIYLKEDMGDDLVFTLSLNDDKEFLDETCEFDFIFNANQITQANNGLGFKDEEIVENIVRSEETPLEVQVLGIESPSNLVLTPLSERDETDENENIPAEVSNEEGAGEDENEQDTNEGGIDEGEDGEGEEGEDDIEDEEHTPPPGHSSTPGHPLSPEVDSPCQEGNLEDGDEEASGSEETFEEEQEDGSLTEDEEETEGDDGEVDESGENYDEEEIGSESEEDEQSEAENKDNESGIDISSEDDDEGDDEGEDIPVETPAEGEDEGGTEPTEAHSEEQDESSASDLEEQEEVETEEEPELAVELASEEVVEDPAETSEEVRDESLPRDSEE